MLHTHIADTVWKFHQDWIKIEVTISKNVNREFWSRSAPLNMIRSNRPAPSTPRLPRTSDLLLCSDTYLFKLALSSSWSFFTYWLFRCTGSQIIWYPNIIRVSWRLKWRHYYVLDRNWKTTTASTQGQ